MTAWALAFLALQLGDVLTTWAALTLTPGAYEANPLAAWLFASVGLWTLPLAKACGALVVLWAGRRVWRSGRACWPLWVCNAGYLWVVANNARIVL